MTNKRFISIFIIMFLLFVAVFGSAGCGGGGSSHPADNEANNPIPSPEQDPTPEPVPTPQPEPEPEPEPTPAPTVYYTVTFDSQGGSSVPSQRVKSGETVTKPVDPTRDGYTFTGWYKSANGTTQFKFGSNGDKITRDITLYAKWSEVPKPKTYYTVTFDSNGGSIVPSQSVVAGGTVTRPVDPVKEGYTFNGWFLASKQFKFGTGGDKVTGDITLVAGWMIINYTVTFDSQGGSSVPNQSVSYGGTISKPSDPVRNGYTFVGWYKNSALTEAFRFGSGGDKVTSNLTLYAKWSMSDSSDNNARADIAVKKISIGYQDGDSSGHVTGNLTLPSKVEVSGDRFNIVWTSNKPTVISTNGTVKRSSSDVSVRLTATVTVGTVNRSATFNVTVIHASTPVISGYTVSFDSKGGSTVASVHVSAGSTVEMPATPTKAGYVFAGWYKDENFTAMFTFGTNGDKINRNTTLYAQWLKLDTLRAEHAIGEIVIGYADGDNPKYVTRNLTLPSKAGDVNITWSSSNSTVISSAGTVTRPSGSDARVTLTATAISGTETSTREFSLMVIRERSRVSRDIEVVPVQDAGSGDLSIAYKASSDQIVDIDGNYSKITIQNADDALDAIQAIHEALGIDNPYKELQTFLITSDSYGSEYSFQQVYKGVKVFGRSVMASTNASDEGNFLHSSLLSSSVLYRNRSNMKYNLTTSMAKSKAKTNYPNNVSADITQQVVYSLDEYENAPVYAYIVRIYGTSGDNYIDDNVFVNADTGEIIMTSPSMCNAVETYRASGWNEFHREVSFDVVRGIVGPIPHMSYIMHDPNLHILMNSNALANVVYFPIHNESNAWTDSHVITVYANMREIMQWWKDNFNRDSIDGNGTTVDIIPHAFGKKDNAAWNYTLHRILTYDRAEDSTYDYFCGAAVDVMTHETTHGAMQYITGGLPNNNATGAMNEGYADIFACIKDENWTIGENLFGRNNSTYCIRNVADPYNLQSNPYNNAEGRRVKAIAWDVYVPTEEIYNSYKNKEFEGEDGDHGVIHQRSLKISHAAYLMHKANDPINGLTWKELATIWYKSLHMGLSASSKFEDVRRCVLWAAQEINLQPNKIAAIKSAFDKVGITASTQKATLKGTVKDYSTSGNLSGVEVAVFDGRISDGAVVGQLFGRKTTKADGSYSFEFEAGTYPVIMQKDGYVMFTGLATITKSEDTTMEVKLVKPGNGSLGGIIRTKQGNSPLQGVTVNIRAGWNVQTGSVVKTTTTDTEGHYSFESLNNGYYSVELIKRGYKTIKFNVTVSGNITNQNGEMSEGVSFRHDISKIDAEIDISTLVEGQYGNGWNFRDGILTLSDNLVYKINCSWGITYNCIKVQDGIEAAVILNNVKIDAAYFKYKSGCAFEIYKAKVELFLQGENLLVSGWARAGLEVTYGSSLTISSINSDDSDSLTAVSSYGPDGTAANGKFGGAGIGSPSSDGYVDGGGARGFGAGIIIIYSGTINALSLFDGPCIGGGNGRNPNNSDGIIIIQGGNINTKTSSKHTFLIGNSVSYFGTWSTRISTRYSIFILGGNISAKAIFSCGDSDYGTIKVLNGIDTSNWDDSYAQVEYADAEKIETMIEEAFLEQESPNDTSDDTQAVQSTATIAHDTKTETPSAPSQINNVNEINYPEILAVIPPFIPAKSGTYTFTASLDREPLEGSSLILLSDSEDIHGTFTETESPLRVKVSADLTAGRTYTPVIVAAHEGESQSGGCNSGIAGIILLAGFIVAFAKRSYYTNT